jgi:hypothetical protein
VERILVEPGDGERVLVLCARLCQELVLAGGVDRGVVLQVADVGDVLDQLDAQARLLGGATDQVRQQEGAHVADVGVAVDGRPAGVERQQSRHERADLLDLAGAGVHQAQHASEASEPAGSCTSVAGTATNTANG